MEGLANLVMILAITFLAWQGGLVLLGAFFWLLSIAVRVLKRRDATTSDHSTGTNA